MSWIEVMPLGDMDEGLGVLVEAEGLRIALFRLDDSVYALDDTCSHAEASLSEGEVFDGAVECPRHGSEFDLESGEPNSLPATRPVATYPTRIDDGIVYLQVGE